MTSASKRNDRPTWLFWTLLALKAGTGAFVLGVAINLLGEAGAGEPAWETGVLFASAFVAGVFAIFLSVWLFGRGLLFLVAGVLIVSIGLAMVGVALFYSELDGGQRVMFGLITGPIFLFLGGAMLKADRSMRRTRRRDSVPAARQR